MESELTNELAHLTVEEKSTPNQSNGPPYKTKQPRMNNIPVQEQLQKRYQQGYKKGYSEGYDQGYKQGLNSQYQYQQNNQQQYRQNNQQQYRQNNQQQYQQNNQQQYQQNNQQQYQQNNRHQNQQNNPSRKKSNNGGVIIVEKSCDNKLGRIEPAIILFKFTTWCADGGGKQSPEDMNSRDTAVRELREESCNLFRFDADVLNSVPMTMIDNHYSLYFVGVDCEINSKYFDENLALLIKNSAPRDWKETNKLHKFYISDIKKMDLSGKHILSNVLDIYGNIMTIKARTKIGIRQGLHDLENNLQYFTPTENLDFRYGTDEFAYGTKCYQL